MLPLLILPFIGVAYATFILAWSRVGWLHSRRRRGVVVHTIEGAHTFSGVLAKSASDGLVLIDATLVDEGGKLQGDVFIPREQVRFIQVIR